MEINKRRCDVELEANDKNECDAELEANDKNECDTELETIDVAVVLRDPYWGNIEGDIHRQEDLQQEFGLYRKKDDQDAIDNEIKEDLDNEITRATNAESSLDKKIDDETTRATTAEGELRTSLDTEIQRATNAEETLTNDLATEVNRATGVESTLSGKIDDEISRAKAKENELNTNLENVESTKLDKVSTANKVYGTDGTGAQTTYDVSKLGQVDDVTYNSKSLVSNRVANLNGFLTYSDEELS